MAWRKACTMNAQAATARVRDSLRRRSEEGVRSGLECRSGGVRAVSFAR